MSEDSEEVVKHLINNYLNSCPTMATDLQDFIQRLTTCEESADQMVIEFTHELDVEEVIQSKDYNFSEYLLKEEKTFGQRFAKRLHRKVGKRVLNGRKIWLCLQYKNLPKNHQLKTYSELKTFHSRVDSNLVSLDSIQIVSMSEPFKTLMASKFVATSAVDGEEAFKWKVRSIHETQEGFGDEMKGYGELKSDRIYGQKRYVLATFGLKSGLNPIVFTIHSNVFTERQLKSIYLGSHLDSVVILRSDSNEYLLLSFGKTFGPKSLSIESYDEFNQYLQSFPQSIQRLYEDRNPSKFGFALSMSWIFGDTVCTVGSFFRLKLGLLLSVLSLNDYPKRNRSSVLVICDDTLMIRRLFDWSSLFSPYRYHQKSTLIPMSGITRKQSALEWTDAGVLQLGADGITIIATSCNLNELSEKERTSLFHALDTNEVIARNSRPSVQTPSEIELKSTVWAVIEDNSEERRSEVKNRTQTILWTQVFAMVYVVEEPNESYFYEPKESPVLDFHEWEQTLSLMNRIEPKMTEEAEDLLQRYYVANRQIRGSKVNEISMQSLASLAKAFAKLSLRLSVEKYDSLMSIRLYEETLTSLSPQLMSPISVEPISHVDANDIQEIIGQNCDQYMSEFENNLNEFLNKTIETKSNIKVNNIVVNEE